jgi:hypothetical protein
MERFIIPLIAVGAAAPTALLLDHIAYDDLGASPDTIGIQALLLAAVIGMALVFGSILRSR